MFFKNLNLSQQTFLALLLLSSGIILFAFFVQYVLGFPPCQLCYKERIPYYITIVISLIGLIANYSYPSKSYYLLFIIAIIMLFSTILGSYHAGVEWSLWQGPSTCSGNTESMPMTIEQMMYQINNTSIVPCNKAPFHILYISPAGYNAIISFITMFISFIIFIKEKKRWNLQNN